MISVRVTFAACLAAIGGAAPLNASRAVASNVDAPAATREAPERRNNQLNDLDALLAHSDSPEVEDEQVEFWWRVGFYEQDMKRLEARTQFLERNLDNLEMMLAGFARRVEQHASAPAFDDAVKTLASYAAEFTQGYKKLEGQRDEVTRALDEERRDV